MHPHNDDTPTSPTLKKAWQELHQVAPNGILNSKKLTRRQRERLSTAGYLDPIMRGWYRLKSPSEQTHIPGFILDFLPIYLEERLGSRWCLSAESSLVVRMNPQTNPGRLVVMAEIGSTTVHTFDCGLRLTIYQDEQQLPPRMETLNGFRVMSLDTILGRMTNTQWNRQKNLVDQVLTKVPNLETMVWQWLSEERYQSAIRLGVRLGELGNTKGYRFVKKCLMEEGLTIPERILTESTQEIVAPATKPIEHTPPKTRDLQTLWKIWSDKLQSLPTPSPDPDSNLLTRLSSIEHALGDDTRHHLALSGFHIPRESVMQQLAQPELAADAHGWPHLDQHERLTEPGEASPLAGETDPQALVSMQGYLEALRLVKRSIVRMMEGQDLQRVLRQDVRGWRMALMSPSAEAGLITRRQVLRYREAETTETDIRNSMENWAELVAQCEPGIQRGLLGFLGIMQIKPWVSGNQRMAFLVLNGLNAAASQPWIVLDQNQKSQLLEAVSMALAEGDPHPLAQLLIRHQI